MATAPTPTTAPNGTPAGEPTRKLKITLGGAERVLDFAEVGPGDDIVARKETGLAISPFLEENTVGADSVLILWWFARRKNGEPRLTFAEVLAEFPTYQALAEAQPEIVMVEDDRPEA